MQKEKKITVKFYLNKFLEAATDDKGGKYYPLYIQVTYNRKNMQFKSKYGMYYESLDEVEKGLMEFEEKMVRKVIRYESSRTKGDYNMKGLKHKYEIYSGSISWALETFLRPKLRLAILKTNNDLTNIFDFQGPKVTAALLYESAKKLLPDFGQCLPVKLKEEMEAYNCYQALYPKPFFNFTFPTLIEWVEGSYKKELEALLKTKYKRKPENVKKVINLIDEMVSYELKKLPG